MPDRTPHPGPLPSRETEKRSRTVTWEDPFLVVQAAPGRTGLELLKELFEGRLPPAAIAQTLGFTGVHVEEGRAIFEEALGNPTGRYVLRGRAAAVRGISG